MKKIFSIPLISILFLWSCTHEPSQTVEPGNNNGGDNGDDNNVVDCDSDTVYFQNDVLPLLQSSCGTMGCHDAGTATEGVILTDYDNIMSTGDVEPFDTEGSDIYELITENDPEDRMPPPPNDPLSHEQIQLIATWINQGALNNECENQDCNTTDVTYAETVSPIFQNFCLGCHDEGTANGGVVLETYDQRSMLANSGALEGVITGSDGYPQMPPDNPLPDCEKTQLIQWVEDGALQN